MELEGIVKVAIAVVIVVAQGIAAVRKARAQRQEQQPVPPPRPRPARPPAPLPPSATAARVSNRPAPAPKPKGPDPALQKLRAELSARARRLSLALEQQRSARRFQPAVDDWFPTALAQGAPPRLLSLVLDQVERMAADRRDPELAGALGDADALATACYAPIVTHARAEGLPLTVAEPAARWGRFDMSLWAGFIPTGVAPLFLPEDFFRRAAWWPAVAHEIGHSFLASVRGLDAGLRAEMGLADERTGLRPLSLGGEGLSKRELERVVGGWFEETFCDVFGTMMCGPAYVRSMHTHFAARGDVRAVLAVGTDGSGYDMHPPRQLRMIAGCRVLERAGLIEDAAALRAEWDERHALEGGAPDRILFPMQDAYLAVPLAPLEELVTGVVDRLYDGPFRVLGGGGLSDIAGLDYGPHEHLEGLRARDALLAGRVPTVRDPRAVIAGAVLAAHARPADEAKILERARAAIPGRDTGEVRPDAYQLSTAQIAPTFASTTPRKPAAAARRPSRRAGAFSAAEVRDAMTLAAVLERRPGPRGRFARRPPGR